MCGIVGVWYFDRSHIVDAKLIQRMTQQLIHRGPDEEGQYTGGSIGLGFRRLSIIDVASSHQPMTNENESLWLVLNGEIYNFQSLYDQLKSRHRFRTKGDTETVLHAFEEYGMKCVEHFRGMFAFALWNEGADDLTLAVDRFGKKPLYYLLDDEKIIFSSELKSILQHPGVSREIDYQALDEYLTYGYIPAPRTIFASIRKVPAGHLLTVKRDRSVSLNEYWHPNLLPPEEWDRRPAQTLAEELHALLIEAVLLRMISDVPLGAFLSGGVDSSVVVSLMSQISTQPIRTFSVGFDEAAYDETRYAQIVAERCRTHHTCEVVHVDVMNILPKLVRQYDEPFADSSMIPTYYVSEVARRHVTVALSGDGGDEVFGGYLHHIYGGRHQLLQSVVPVSLRPAVERIGHVLPASHKLKPYLSVISKPVSVWALRNGFFTATQRSMLYTQEAVDRLGSSDAERLKRDIFSYVEQLDGVSQLQYDDLRMYLPGDILAKVDRASMLASLEVRSPLLDHVVFEFMARVPSVYKTNGFDTKILLKRALGTLLPDEIHRRKKAGFSIPLKEWLAGPLYPMLQEILLGDSARQRGIFNPEHVEQLINEHGTGQCVHSERLWSLLCFELWARHYVSN
ncbi:MAG: asparagine synthase (glutamine-hydrolyzing) [Anaerolineae bacterium]|nr:asparagine synthase (glutamine-hydrolyzing) [Anaerolineae bacterium]